ncbi:hypothetical protein BaRGS_00029735 [Batillaria attramentaria]|uniref:Uncharacterized protein n=1 Tax=Batillaria attramentaria TaxID=370345 RepID=A0ABD0JW56_9CAEN
MLTQHAENAKKETLNLQTRQKAGVPAGSAKLAERTGKPGTDLFMNEDENLYTCMLPVVNGWATLERGAQSSTCARGHKRGVCRRVADDSDNTLALHIRATTTNKSNNK